jgi:hypothetical protein
MTLDRESELTLVSDAVAAAAFLAERGGQLHVPVNGDGAVWWAELRPASDPGETYYARLGWTAYPGAPPSIKFATSLGGAITDPAAWPLTPGCRPTALDMCKPIGSVRAIAVTLSSSRPYWLISGPSPLVPFRAFPRERTASI